MSDKDKTTTCRVDEIVLGPPLHLNYTCDVVVVTQADADRPIRGVAERANIALAMAAMANVMRGLDDTAIRMRWEDIAYEYLCDDRNRNEAPPAWRKAMRFMADGGRDRASARWSARVRAGVAALPKPGPVVCCQGDYDDE